jgi:hypothetical protein
MILSFFELTKILQMCSGQESKQKKANLNISVNQILAFYVNRNKPSQIAIDIPISKGLVLFFYHIIILNRISRYFK